MSRDVLTVGSIVRILSLYRGEYSQWVERFINYLEEQTDGEAMINSIKNVINDLKKCGYSKDNCELNFKFLNNLQPEWKQYAIMMRQNKNLMDINIDALYNILKQNQGDVNDAMGLKKKTVVVTYDPLALIAEKINVSRSKEKVVESSDSEGSEADDFSELKKITALLAKELNRRKFYSKPTNNNLRTSSSSQYANKKQEFVKTDNKTVEKKDDEKKRDMSRVKCYNCKKAKVKDYEYYKTKMLLVKKDKDEQVLLAEDQAWIESSSDSDQEINTNMVFMAQIKKVISNSEASSSSVDEKIYEEKYAKLKAERYEYMIRYSAYFDNDKQHRKHVADQQVLYDKMSVQLVELDKHVRDLKNKVLEKDFKISELEECVRNKDLEIEKCLERLNVYENKLHKLEKIIIDLEDEVMSLSEKEKANLETIESLKSKGFESSENVSSEPENQTKNDCLVVEKECDKEDNPKVIAPKMFKLNVSQCVSPISMSKSLCDSKNVEIKLKRKRRTSSVLTNCGNINTTSGNGSASSGNTYSVAIFIAAVL
nr:nucleolar protein 58-like [Tanacetum cinerariifolium]